MAIIYYTLLDRGMMTCHEARTGREIYGKQRIDPEDYGVYGVAVGL